MFSFIFLLISLQKDDDNESTCSSTSRRSTCTKSSLRSHTPGGLLDYQMAVFNDSDSDDDGEPKHPLVMLAKAARVMNAQQMDLSKDLVSHVNLPGKCFCVFSLFFMRGGMDQEHGLVYTDC